MSEGYKDWERWQVCPICGDGLPQYNFCNRHGDVSQFRGETLNVVIPEEIKEVEKAKEDIEKVSQALWRRELLNYLKEEKLADERELEAFEKNWEKEYGENVVALKNHPFRSRSIVHKGDPR